MISNIQDTIFPWLSASCRIGGSFCIRPFYPGINPLENAILLVFDLAMFEAFG